MRGKRVRLTPLRDRDSAVLYEWINDRELVILNSPFNPVSESEHQRWFDQIRERTDVDIFGIRLDEEEGLIGSCQLLHIVEERGTCEIQIRIAEADARGNGYGTEAINLLLDRAFGERGLHRVEARIWDTNEPALRTFEKAGFVREGLLRDASLVEGERKNLVVMSVLAGEHSRDER